MTEPLHFPYYKSVAPMMWVFFALSIIELVVVHIFVALKWPWIGWPLTILSTIGAVWILFWIRSFRMKPHSLKEDRLTLNFGSVKTIELDLDRIARVKGSWEQGALEKKGVINLAGIAFPNRCIELAEPLEKGRERVFVRLDSPEPFDTALSERGVTFE